MIKAQKEKAFFSTAAPFTFTNDKSLSYRNACFRDDKRPSFKAIAKPLNHFNAHGGGSFSEVEEYALKTCELTSGRPCVILLTNGRERCAATFEAAYGRALAKIEEGKNLKEKLKAEDEYRKAEAMKSTCIAFGFGPNTTQMSTCVMELFKTTAQVEAIRQASESQVRATSAAAEETTRLLEFQQGMELLRQSNQMLAPVLRQNSSTTNCRYNAIMKTIVCN